MHLKPYDIVVFTDGASRGNPGPGGWAAIIIFPEENNEIKDLRLKIQEIGGRETWTTNNRMELTAAINALFFLSTHNLHLTTLIYTDSTYVVNGITKWVHGWQKNNWKTAAKKDVENRDLLEQLFYSTIYRTIKWKYVGGHVGVQGNERADEIATAFAKGKKPKLYSGSLEKYPIKNILDTQQDLTSLPIHGQTLLRNRSKVKAHSYVSLVDGAVQTHKTWKECEARVKGTSGAKYQKVFSAEAERSLVRAWGRMK